MNCDKCRWYKEIRQPTKEEMSLQRFYGIKFDLRECIMGGCDGSGFEEEPNTFNALDALNAENKNGFDVDI